MKGCVLSYQGCILSYRGCVLSGLRFVVPGIYDRVAFCRAQWCAIHSHAGPMVQHSFAVPPNGAPFTRTLLPMAQHSLQFRVPPSQWPSIGEREGEKSGGKGNARIWEGERATRLPGGIHRGERWRRRRGDARGHTRTGERYSPRRL